MQLGDSVGHADDAREVLVREVLRQLGRAVPQDLPLPIRDVEGAARRPAASR